MDIKLLNDELYNSSLKLREILNEGLKWVNDYVQEDRKEVSISNLKTHRRRLNRYLNAIYKRPAIAIFGQSQVGKSYLVSNLTKRPEDYSLYIKIPGTDEQIDFITNINPPGGGKEATGLVSRFTTADNWQPGWKPFEIVLFSQADIVKVIANGYFSDITHYTYTIDRDKIQQKISDLYNLRMKQPAEGLTEDDIFDIKEYLNDKFPDHFILKDLNNINFWEDIAIILPFIPATERWRLFEFLWGQQPFFTDLFNKLTHALQKLGFRPSVRCDIDALAPQSDTILDVERLRELYKDVNREPVKLYDGDKFIAQLDRSILSALTAEVILPLADKTAEHPKRQFLKQADVLDFPGARSRQQIPEDTFEDKSADDKLFVYLRGKVAYLFHRYNINFEISTLLFCMDDRQPEVTDLPKFIYEWIRDVHGASPEQRDNREKHLAELLPGTPQEKLIPLLVVLTKFNIELAGNPATEKPGDLEPHNAKWDKRLRANFAEFMSISLSDDWINHWNLKGAFKNVFPLRDPKWSQNIYEGYKEHGKEIAVKPEYELKLQDMYNSWIKHPYVNRHIHNPEKAWKEVTELNKDGLDYIIEYLTPTTNPIIKYQQLKDKIAEIKTATYDDLALYYTGGSIDEKLQRAKKDAMKVFLILMKMQNEKNSFGYLLDYLKIDDDIAWKVYFDFMMREQVSSPEEHQTTDEVNTLPIDLVELLRQFVDISDNDNPETIIKKLKDFFSIDDDDLLRKTLQEAGINIDALIEASKKPETIFEKYDKSYIFAQKLIARWLKHLENLKQERVYKELGLSKDVIYLIISELEKAKNRVNLKSIIANKTREHIETFQNTNSIDIVARISAAVLNLFVNTLGWIYEPFEKRPKVKPTDAKPVFSDVVVHTPEKKELKLGIKFPGESFFVQWVAAMRATFEANVYYEENIKDEFQVKRNSLLAEILNKLQNIKL